MDIINKLNNEYFEITFMCIALVIYLYMIVKHFRKYNMIIFAITVPALIFIKLSEELIQKELSVFDNVIYKYISLYISNQTTYMMKILTYFGSGEVLVFLSILSLIYALKFVKNKKHSFYISMISANLVLSTILNETFKMIFHRERPDINRLISVGGFSFPSGHSMIGLCFYGYIIYLLYKHMKTKYKYIPISLLATAILLIGVSRIYLGVHYASDVISGFSAGLVILMIFVVFTEKMCNLKFKEKNDIKEEIEDIGIKK